MSLKLGKTQKKKCDKSSRNFRSLLNCIKKKKEFSPNVQFRTILAHKDRGESFHSRYKILHAWGELDIYEMRAKILSEKFE